MTTSEHSAPDMAVVHNPGAVQGVILLSCVCFPVMATSLLGPVLPAMEKHFAAIPNVQTLVPIMLTVAILSLALFSGLVGSASDRFGRKRILLAALALYGFAGTAPIYLESLHAIIASRILVGVAEAGIVACSTAIIGDYFHGPQLVRYMSLQSTVASLSAFVFNGLGGVLGEQGWRVPFATYVLAFGMFLLVAGCIWDVRGDRAFDSSAPEGDSLGVRFRPWLLAWICVVAVVGGAVFIMVPVHLAYVVVDLGTNSPRKIGLAYAANSIGVACGTVLFGWYLARRWGIAAQIFLCAAISASGFLVMSAAHDYMMTVIGGVLNGVGCGIVLPMLLTWSLRELPYARRGVGLGAVFSSYFLGSFINPLVVVPMGNALGSRGAAIHTWGVVLLGLAFLAAVFAFKAGGKLVRPSARTHLH